MLVWSLPSTQSTDNPHSWLTHQHHLSYVEPLLVGVTSPALTPPRSTRIHCFRRCCRDHLLPWTQWVARASMTTQPWLWSSTQTATIFHHQSQPHQPTWYLTSTIQSHPHLISVMLAMVPVVIPNLLRQTHPQMITNVYLTSMIDKRNCCPDFTTMETSR
jgi:hypothetical protein